MIELYRSEDDTLVGTVSEEALDFLIEHLEEEDAEDTEYYIDRDTIDFLNSKNPPAGLIDVLEAAIAGREDAEVYYLPDEVEEGEAAADEA